MNLPDHLALASRQGGLLSRSQLRHHGLSRALVARQVERGILLPLSQNVFRVAGTPTNHHQHLWSLVLGAEADSVLTRRTAAHLHRVGRFGPWHDDLVQVGNPSRPTPLGTGHRSILLPTHHRTTIDGLPVTTLARTMFDLAALVSAKRWRRQLPSLTMRQVERTLDDALVGDLSFEEAVAVLDELGGRGRGGTVVLRELLSYRGPGFVATESELEDLLASVLDRHGMPAPVRQRNLGGDDRIGRVDFAYLPELVVIEADGRKNHTALLDREGDAWRDLELAALGFVVVRVNWRQLKDNSHRFVSALRRVLTRRAVGRQAA